MPNILLTCAFDEKAAPAPSAARNVDSMSTTGSGRDELAEESIAKPFDQTNGLMDAGGDSDGTAESDTKSEAERQDDRADGSPTTDDGGTDPTSGDVGLAGGAAGLSMHRGG
jgi:hypothetical protein